MQNTLSFLAESQLRADRFGRDKFFQSRFDFASNLYCKDLKAHYSCVNAIEFANSGKLIASGIFLILFIMRYKLIWLKTKLISRRWQTSPHLECGRKRFWCRGQEGHHVHEGPTSQQHIRSRVGQPRSANVFGRQRSSSDR